jgi:hypothetical protein
MSPCNPLGAFDPIVAVIGTGLPVITEPTSLTTTARGESRVTATRRTTPSAMVTACGDALRLATHRIKALMY